MLYGKTPNCCVTGADESLFISHRSTSSSPGSGDYTIHLTYVVVIVLLILKLTFLYKISLNITCKSDLE